MPFLERDSSWRLPRLTRYRRQSSPRALLRKSRTRSCCRLPILASADGGKWLLFSCNFVSEGRQSVNMRTPTYPILFSPNSNDLSPLKDCSCKMSSSVTSCPGRSISSVSSVTVIFWIVTRESDREALGCGAVAEGESRSISSLRDI